MFLPTIFPHVADVYLLRPIYCLCRLLLVNMQDLQVIDVPDNIHLFFIYHKVGKSRVIGINDESF